MDNKTVFYAGYWNSSHTLAKIELEFREMRKANNTWTEWQIVKVLKIYAGGNGMLVGMSLLDDEVAERTFDNYADAKRKITSDCPDKIGALFDEAAVFAKEMDNIYGLVE